MIDFRPVAEEYGRYRPTYPVELVERVRATCAHAKFNSVLDLGCGAGNLARTLAPLCKWLVAADKAHELVVQAGKFSSQTTGQFATVVATAEHLPFPSHTFDWVFAAQAWHLFDRAAALAEIQRVLNPQGALAVLYFSRLELAGNVVELTHEVIRRHNPAWTHGGVDGLYPEFIREIQEFGFGSIQTFSFDKLLRYSRDEWIGRIIASKGVGASLGGDLVSAFADDLRHELQQSSLSFPLDVPHRFFVITAVAP